MHDQKVTGALLISLFLLSLMVGCSAPPLLLETSLEVQISEKGFTPDALYVPTGKELSVTLTNTTTTDHKWIILADPYVNPYVQGSPSVYFQIDVPAGKTVNTSFLTPESPIQLDVVCENDACIKAGMNAILVVVEQ